jgi:hypothetical protein
MNEEAVGSRRAGVAHTSVPRHMLPYIPWAAVLQCDAGPNISKKVGEGCWRCVRVVAIGIAMLYRGGLFSLGGGWDGEMMSRMSRCLVQGSRLDNEPRVQRVTRRPVNKRISPSWGRLRSSWRTFHCYFWRVKLVVVQSRLICMRNAEWVEQSVSMAIFSSCSRITGKR